MTTTAFVNAAIFDGHRYRGTPGTVVVEDGHIRAVGDIEPPSWSVLVDAAGARLLEEGRSVPLDAYAAGARPRAEATVQLAPGDELVLITDGLIERRREPLDDGFERLLAATAGRRSPADLIRLLAVDDHDDDVCVLRARLSA